MQDNHIYLEHQTAAVVETLLLDATVLLSAWIYLLLLEFLMLAWKCSKLRQLLWSLGFRNDLLFIFLWKLHIGVQVIAVYLPVVWWVSPLPLCVSEVLSTGTSQAEEAE